MAVIKVPQLDGFPVISQRDVLPVRVLCASGVSVDKIEEAWGMMAAEKTPTVMLGGNVLRCSADQCDELRLRRRTAEAFFHGIIEHDPISFCDAAKRQDGRIFVRKPEPYDVISIKDNDGDWWPIIEQIEGYHRISFNFNKDGLKRVSKSVDITDTIFKASQAKFPGVARPWG